MAYDSAATRERILAAATQEFPAHGVSGAREDRIAAEAKADKRAIYNLDGLGTEVARAVRDLPGGGERS
jgi:hypothetical protein